MFIVTPIPAFNDNYIWALTTEADLESVVVVDPGDAEPVQQWLTKEHRTLKGILVTHHHNDHTGGVKLLREQFDVAVYGPANSPFDGITHPMKTGDRIVLLDHELIIHEVPAHTRDHISFLQPNTTPQLFCGDTLFLAGCGRLFEGTARQMLTAMQYFSSLSDDTEVYCTHEYSLANLAFAAHVEPGNTDIQEARQTCHQLRLNNQPTLPSSIGQEKRINPFMRTDHPSVASAAEHFCGNPLHSEVEVLAALREWKNQF
ncbi:hydroxyacylglutathione hydrolase [Marinobacterium sediminicola]|uniref:Hydroxyacylglutathione hydrolase n=1 Tax=Marinobacterium sediminicola TaxID=518898 RepID=A0ABY1RXI3_9GAMM|nr:hydroxyacylglutathione hydrolase [Marinobacterium sediminicola]ULG67871.1 hydroxyacylglutathione hydrolase [Marinobacterium sediminicola]SMR71427.1 hydroxyacylglutathione hydrolase [Marinobacterium sediminicola]